jgi:hypothetical protein
MGEPMKHFIAMALALTSLSAFSAVEFYSKNGNEECTISKNKVSRTSKFMKGAAGFTTTKTIETFGLDALVTKAVAASTGKPAVEGYAFMVTVDGQASTLHYQDSKEAGSLILFIQRACFN